MCISVLILACYHCCWYQRSPQTELNHLVVLSPCFITCYKLYLICQNYSVSGKTFQLYSHNLIGLFEQLKKPGIAAQFQTHRFPERILPRYTQAHFWLQQSLVVDYCLVLLLTLDGRCKQQHLSLKAISDILLFLLPIAVFFITA